MYGKLFASLYQGTLRGKSHEILVFTNLIANADAAGHVDKHFRAIAEEVGITVEEVKAAILVLESPDPESRSPEAAGARLLRMDEHRAWGWRITNHAKYRAIRNEEDRREQNRQAQERFRNKSKPRKPMSAQAEAEAEAEAEVGKERESGNFPQCPPMTRTEFNTLCQLRAVPADCAEWFWNTHDAVNWLDGQKRPIQKVEPLLMRTLANWRANGEATNGKTPHGTGPAAKRPKTPLDLKTIIQAKETLAGEIRKKHCSDVAMGESWPNAEKKAEYFKLKREIKELNTQISSMA